MARTILLFTLEQIIDIWSDSDGVHRVTAATGYKRTSIANVRSDLRVLNTLQEVIDWYNDPIRQWNKGKGLPKPTKRITLNQPRVRAKPGPKPKYVAPPAPPPPTPVSVPVVQLKTTCKLHGVTMRRPWPSAPNYVVLTLDEFKEELKGQVVFTATPLKAHQKYLQSDSEGQ